MIMKIENNIKWACYYRLGAILQIALVSCVIVFLKLNKIEYGNIASLIFLVLGGLSSAIWGIIISKKSGRVNSYKRIIIDFFHVKQPIKLYIMTFVFLLIIFGKSIIFGQVLNGISFYSFIFFFIQAIIFGGIEEIGWRYTFQPILEKRLPIEAASLITFISWGIWHYMYFYITNSMHNINHITFLISLLGNCFILGVIFRVSHSLWLCVMYHAFLNMFSQTLIASTINETIITTGICIVLSIIIVRRKKFRNYLILEMS